MAALDRRHNNPDGSGCPNMRIFMMTEGGMTEAGGGGGGPPRIATAGSADVGQPDIVPVDDVVARDDNDVDDYGGKFGNGEKFFVLVGRNEKRLAISLKVRIACGCSNLTLNLLHTILSRYSF